MREQRLPSSYRRRRVVILSATPSSPSHAQLRRAAVGSPIAAFDQPQRSSRQDKGRSHRRAGRVPPCRSGLRMAGFGNDGMSGLPSTTTGTAESGLGWWRLGFRRCPSRPISSNGADDHAARRTEQRADDLGWEPSRNSRSRPPPGAMGAASSVDMEETRVGGRGSRAAHTTGLHGRRLHGSRRVQIAIWGKEQGRGGEVREKEAVDSCERVPREG